MTSNRPYAAKFPYLRGKGDVDREIPLSQKLLETFREYWRWMRPQTYLFPGNSHPGWIGNRTRVDLRGQQSCHYGGRYVPSGEAR